MLLPRAERKRNDIRCGAIFVLILGQTPFPHTPPPPEVCLASCVVGCRPPAVSLCW